MTDMKDDPLSPESRAKLEAGLESAAHGEIQPFTGGLVEAKRIVFAKECELILYDDDSMDVNVQEDGAYLTPEEWRGLRKALMELNPNIGSSLESLLREVAHPDDIILTREEIESELEKISREVMGCGSAEAWERVRGGELEGTLFASKMRRLRSLLGGDRGIEKQRQRDADCAELAAGADPQELRDRNALIPAEFCNEPIDWAQADKLRF